MSVERGLAHLELPDTAAGRRRFLEWTDECIDWNQPGKAGDRTPEGQSLHSTLRRGWYFGGEELRERLIAILGKDDGSLKDRRRRGYTGSQARDHGEAEARRIVGSAETVFALEAGDWAALKKGDWRKGVVAGLIRRRALVDNGWLAQELHMGARNAVSRTIRQAREHLASHPKDQTLSKRLERDVKKF